MGPEKTFLEKELSKHFGVKTKVVDGDSTIDSIDTESESATKELLEKENETISQLENGNLQHISLYNGQEEVLDLDITPLRRMERDILQLKNQIETVDRVGEKLDRLQELSDTLKSTQAEYDNKAAQLEDRILENYAKVDNSLHKKQGKESKIPTQISKKLIKTITKMPKEFLGQKFEIFKSKKVTSPARKQQLDNRTYNKMRKVESAMNKLRTAKPTMNADLLAEEILQLLISPLTHGVAQGVSAAHKVTQPKRRPAISNELKPVNLKIDRSAPFSMIYKDKTYNFQGYSQDLKGIILGDLSTGKTYKLENDVNRVLRPNTNLKLSNIQKDLLERGSTLMITNNVKHPFKLQGDQMNPKFLNITTITSTEFKNQYQNQSLNKSKNKSQNISQ